MGYDRETATLNISTADGIVFDLRLRHGINLVRGESATGKTLLCRLIEKYKKLGADIPGWANLSNICVADTRKSLIDSLDETADLIIIDFADDILDDELVERINRDRTRSYLIFTRTYHGFRVTTNRAGEFVRDGKTVRIQYMSNQAGWF